jgi:hypothetical protein
MQVPSLKLIPQVVPKLGQVTLQIHTLRQMENGAR